MTRSHQIKAFFLVDEAVILLDDDTQDRILTICFLFIRVFRRWYRDEMASGRQAYTYVNTAPLVALLNRTLRVEGEYRVQFGTQIAGDPDILFAGGTYTPPSTDVITINIIQVYRFPRAPDHPFSALLLNNLKALLDHEFIHRGQLLRRELETIPEKPTDRQHHRLPHFGTRAHEVAREQNARTLARAKARGTEITKKFRQENLVHAAKSLTRRGFFR